MTEIISFLKEHDQLILAASSLLVSIVAIWISVYQIGLSNRHLLFEKRLEQYIFIHKVRRAFYSSKSFLKNQDRLEIDEVNAFLCRLTDIANCGKLRLAKFDMTVLDFEDQDRFDFNDYCDKTYISAGVEISTYWYNGDGARAADFIFSFGHFLIALGEFKQCIFEEQEKYQTFEYTDQIINELSQLEEWKVVLEHFEEVNMHYEVMEESHALDNIRKTLKIS